MHYRHDRKELPAAYRLQKTPGFAGGGGGCTLPSGHRAPPLCTALKKGRATLHFVCVAQRWGSTERSALPCAAGGRQSGLLLGSRPARPQGDPGAFAHRSNTLPGALLNTRGSAHASTRTSQTDPGQCDPFGTAPQTFKAPLYSEAQPPPPSPGMHWEAGG